MPETQNTYIGPEIERHELNGEIVRRHLDHAEERGTFGEDVLVDIDDNALKAMWHLLQDRSNAIIERIKPHKVGKLRRAINQKLLDVSGGRWSMESVDARDNARSQLEKKYENLVALRAEVVHECRRRGIIDPDGFNETLIE